MTLKQATEILRSHQEWRIGNIEITMVKPSKLTEAMSVILAHLEGHKEQIMAAFTEGDENGWNRDSFHNQYKDAEQYYSQTFPD